MATNSKPFLSPEEYLEMERRAETKSEYWRGQMYAMSGATRNHVRITTNLIAALHQRLRGTKCNVYGPDLRVHVPATGLCTYPDVIVTCGEEKFLDVHFDTLENPLVIIEVLSDSTQNYDRGGKFFNYRSLASLAEYLTVAQDEPLVEHFVRQHEGWLLIEHRDPLAGFALVSLPEIELPLAEVYENVEWPERA